MKGENTGGDQSSTKTCPFCGKAVVSTRWPQHLATCDGGETA